MSTLSGLVSSVSLEMDDFDDVDDDPVGVIWDALTHVRSDEVTRTMVFDVIILLHEMRNERLLDADVCDVDAAVSALTRPSV